MSEKIHGLPKATVEKSYFTWALWLVPLAAIGLCGWFVADDFLLSGPTITIYFPTANGLQKGDSPVKYRGIQIGQVQSLDLAPGHQRVIVTAKLNRSAKDIARQGSVFWIVHPEVKLGAVKALNTIVSGDYVTVEPGNGPPTNAFIGLAQAPIPPVKGVQITLFADELDSLEDQSPIFYRNVQVGEVLNFRLSDDASYIVIHARIRREYAPLVRMNSQFWNAGGINLHFGIFSGLQVSAQSLQTVVSGGIAFATPSNYGPPATNGTIFTLNKKEDDSWKNWNPKIPLNNSSKTQTTEISLSQTNSK